MFKKKRNDSKDQSSKREIMASHWWPGRLWLHTSLLPRSGINLWSLITHPLKIKLEVYILWVERNRAMVAAFIKINFPLFFIKFGLGLLLERFSGIAYGIFFFSRSVLILLILYFFSIISLKYVNMILFSCRIGFLFFFFY